MDRNDYGRYRDRDERPRYQQDYSEREGERRWENEGGPSGRNNNDDDRRWAEGGQGGWQWREEWRNRHEPRDQSRNREEWRSRDEWQARDRDDRWGRFPPEGNRFDRNDDYRREGRRDWSSRYYPSSGTYGSSSGTYGGSSGYGGSGYGTAGRETSPGYGSSGYGTSGYGTSGYGSSGYAGVGYQGERSDRDYRGSYDDSPAINRESRPGYRPYQQATGQAGQERYRYEEQVRRGKAPRSYKRSDDRIHDEICEIVARDSDVDASEVDVKVQNGEVTLAGTVEDRRAKRELEDIAERVFGVIDIHNDLRVRKSLFNELGERIFGSSDDRTTGTSSTTQNKSQTGQKM